MKHAYRVYPNNAGKEWAARLQSPPATESRDRNNTATSMSWTDLVPRVQPKLSLIRSAQTLSIDTR
eukprot:scaffold952_cov409-Prasinococcus_capsulatus_cf.AAC.34